MFAKAESLAHWDAARYHIRCYAHKLALVVKAGLSYLKIQPKNLKIDGKGLGPVPDIPLIELNGGEGEVEAKDTDSESCKHFRQCF